MKLSRLTFFPTFLPLLVSSSRALDTLSDVLGNFLSNFCKIMRVNADQLCESGTLSFRDVLDQSLQQCGFGGKAELQQYWNSKVKGYKYSLDEEVERQMTEYRSLTVSHSLFSCESSCDDPYVTIGTKQCEAEGVSVHCTMYYVIMMA